MTRGMRNNRVKSEYKIEFFINLFQAIFFFFSIISIWFYSKEIDDIAIGFIIILCITFALKHTILYRFFVKGYNLNWMFIILLFETYMVYYLSLFDMSNFNYYIFDVLISEAVFFTSIFFSIIVTSSIFLWSIFSSNINNLPSSHIARNGLSFLFVFSFMLLVKVILQKSKTLKEAKELMDKQNKMLERANFDIQKSTLVLKDMIILKERNRIAKEIHDGVGHSLTIAIIQLEAVKRVLKKDIDLGYEKILIIEDIIREGMRKLRKSVRMLKINEMVEDNLQIALTKNIIEMQRTMDIKIEYNFSNLRPFSKDLNKFFYNVFQEGITNGLKHGNASEFKLNLGVSEDYISFSLNDNGKGSENFIEGFGLNSMKEKVRFFNGKINIASEKNEGFNISILVPVCEKEGVFYEKN